MESSFIIKGALPGVYRDEKHSLLYCYTGSTKVYVVNTETAEIVASFSVNSNAMQFLFSEDKEFLIIFSCTCEVVVYRANEYAEPYWKFKLKRTNSADYSFVIRDNILYGFACAGKDEGLRYFIINLITREIKDEYCPHPEGAFGYGHAARGLYKLGEISGEVESLYDNVLKEQQGREIAELKALFSAVPDEYFSVYGTQYYCKSNNYEFIFTRKGLLVVPDGAPLPKDYARAVNDKRILRENAIIGYACKFCYDAANDCIYARKTWQDDDNSKILYKISAESGKIVQSVKLRNAIYDILSVDGDYLIVETGGSELVVFRKGNIAEPHMCINLKELCDSAAQGDWHYFGGKIYASELNKYEPDGKLRGPFEPFKSREEVIEFNKKYSNGDYETVDFVFQSDYFVLDLSTGETQKIATDSIYRTHVIEDKILNSKNIYNSPEFWSQAVERAENAAKGLTKAKIPQKYANVGCEDYFSNGKFELVSFVGGVAVLAKGKNAGRKNEPEEKEIKYDEKYLTEHGITNDFLENYDDGEALEFGYSWAVESIDRKAKAAGLSSFSKFLNDPTVTDEEIILYSVGWLDIEIKEGGAEQYFYNGDSCEFEALLRALKLIGAAQTEKTVERCVKLRQKYESIVEPSEEATEKYYEKLTDEWDNLTEDYIELAIDYIRKIHK